MPSTSSQIGFKLQLSQSNLTLFIMWLRVSVILLFFSANFSRVPKEVFLSVINITLTPFTPGISLYLLMSRFPIFSKLIPLLIDFFDILTASFLEHFDDFVLGAYGFLQCLNQLFQIGDSCGKCTEPIAIFLPNVFKYGSFDL